MGAALALLELYALSCISMAKESGECEVQNITEHPEEENGQMIFIDMGMLTAIILQVIDIYY